jgi:hypothetical protein
MPGRGRKTRTGERSGASAQRPQSEHVGYDQTLKQLLLRAHDAFVDLIVPGLHWRSERSPEVPANARQADLAWEVEAPDGERGILHVELQTAADPGIGERVADYALRLRLRDHLPVYSVVIFLRPAETLPESPFGWSFLGQERHRTVFEVIRLWEVPAERVLSRSEYALWPLSVLMAGMDETSTRTVADRLAGAPLPRPERGELIWTLAVLATMRLPREAIRELFRRDRMLKDILEETNFMELWDEIFGEDRREQGREQGMREMARSMAETAWEGRFGPPAEEVRSALQRADVDALKALVAHIATDSIEQARARLGRPPSDAARADQEQR